MFSVIFRIKENIRKNKWLFILQLSIFALGIIFGIISYKNNDKLYNYYDNSYLMYDLYFSRFSSAFKLFFIRLVNGLFLMALIVLLSLKRFTYLFQTAIILFRGIVLGLAICVFYSVFSIQGIFIIVFLIIPQNFIVTLAIIIFNVAYFPEISCNNWIKRLITYGIVSLIIILIGALYELILLLVFIRPTTMYF